MILTLKGEILPFYATFKILVRIFSKMVEDRELVSIEVMPPTQEGLGWGVYKETPSQGSIYIISKFISPKLHTSLALDSLSEPMLFRFKNSRTEQKRLKHFIFLQWFLEHSTPQRLKFTFILLLRILLSITDNCQRIKISPRQQRKRE